MRLHNLRAAPMLLTTIGTLAVLMLTTLPSPAHTQRVPERRTYDRCTASPGCGKGLMCLQPVGTTGAKECDSEDERKCTCFPESLKPITCTEGDANPCPPGERCADIPVHPKPVCVSCLAIVDPDRDDDDFVVSEDVFADCQRTAEPQPSPSPPKDPPALAWDFCSPDVACDTPRLACRSLFTELKMPCTTKDVRCVCSPADVNSCAEPADCATGETCAISVFDDRSECVSCNRLRISLDFRERPSDRCQNVADKEIPAYPPSTNGRTFDICEADITCSQPSKCRFANFRPCDNANYDVCYCLPATPAKLKECTTSTECALGESCAQNENLPGASDRKVCASDATIATIGGRTKVFGKQVAATPQPGRGLTNDDCKFDWHCAAPRRCQHKDTLFGGCAGRLNCFCMSLSRPTCRSDADCAPGEQCANYAGALRLPSCLSKRFISREPLVFTLAGLNETRPVPVYEKGTRLTLDSCREVGDCKPATVGKRECVHITEDSRLCGGREGCICKRPFGGECTATSECEPGEECVLPVDTGKTNAICISREVVENAPENRYRRRADLSPSPSVSPTPSASPSPPLRSDEPVASSEEGTGDEKDSEEEVEESPICIDANALTHMEDSELVFDSARRARVLCDLDGNCATAGHMVVWQGSAMMMRSYCDLHAQCSKRSMLVNSPKMRKGLRVPSRTRGFEFTALAARFESVAEETVLKHLVHFGL